MNHADLKKAVSYDPNTGVFTRQVAAGRFRASCSVGGVKYHLGVFATAEEAHGAYASFKKEHVDVC